MLGKLYGLIGHPVEHSMSPCMHNKAFLQMQLEHQYHAFDIEPQRLADGIKALRLLNVSGFNVTIPHKVEIMKYLDDIDEEAVLIGAVNTVVNMEGRLIGYNTDGRGYVESLNSVLQLPLPENKVLVIGAGGAARAIITSMVLRGVKELHIINRTLEKARQIKANCDQFKTKIELYSLNDQELDLSVYDIIINTTSIGMFPRVDEIPLPLNQIRSGTICSDLIYNPLKTNWLQEAEQKGAIIHSGVGMFVQQGALAFELWTSRKPNIEEMTKTVMRQLGG